MKTARKLNLIALALAMGAAAPLGAASLDELARDGDGAYRISSSDDWNALSSVLAAGIP